MHAAGGAKGFEVWMQQRAVFFVYIGLCGDHMSEVKSSIGC